MSLMHKATCCGQRRGAGAECGGRSRLMGARGPRRRTGGSCPHPETPPPVLAHLKEDKEGQADSQEDPELPREVVVLSAAVVPVPGAGKYRGQGTGVQRAPRGHGGPNLHSVTFSEPSMRTASWKSLV